MPYTGDPGWVYAVTTPDRMWTVRVVSYKGGYWEYHRGMCFGDANLLRDNTILAVKNKTFKPQQQAYYWKYVSKEEI